MMDTRKPPGIRISQIYLESSSFRHRDDHLHLPRKTPPDLGLLDIEISSGVVEDKSKALVRIRVSTSPKGTGLYAFDVTMVALLRTHDEPNMPLEQYIDVSGPTLLFPFLRETVANLTSRGRFGPIYLSPFNVKAAFEAGSESSAGVLPPAKQEQGATKRKTGKAGKARQPKKLPRE